MQVITTGLDLAKRVFEVQASRNAFACVTSRFEWRSSRFTMKKNVPPETRLRR